MLGKKTSVLPGGPVFHHSSSISQSVTMLDGFAVARKRKATYMDAEEPVAKIRSLIAHKRRSLSAACILVLPTELLARVADFLNICDLRTLTCVNHRLADIAGPIYMTKQQLVISAVTISLKNSAFNALSVWRRSLAFQPKRFLICTLNGNTEKVDKQIKQLGAFLSTRSGCEEVVAYHLNSIPPFQLVDLIRVVGEAKCKAFEIDTRAISLQMPSPAIGIYQPRAKRLLYLPSISVFCIFYRRLSSRSWDNLLSDLHLPALKSLKIDNQVPMSALGPFLARHPHIQKLRFRGTLTSTMTTSKVCLHLPTLRRLQGPLPQVLGVLKSLSSPPTFDKLYIDTVTNLPYPVFVRDVGLCLALCRGPLSLKIGFQPPSGYTDHMLEELYSITPLPRTRRTQRCAGVREMSFRVVDVCEEATRVLCSVWATSFSHAIPITVEREDQVGRQLAQRHFSPNADGTWDCASSGTKAS